MNPRIAPATERLIANGRRLVLNLCDAEETADVEDVLSPEPLVGLPVTWLEVDTDSDTLVCIATGRPYPRPLVTNVTTSGPDVLPTFSL